VNSGEVDLGDASQTVPIRMFTARDGWKPAEDVVVVEEPLQLRLGGEDLAVIMRTPGDELDLAVGFLISEGIVQGFDEIASTAFCSDDHDRLDSNVVNVNLHEAFSIDPGRWKRNFYAASSCGICGKASVEAIRMNAAPLEGGFSISADTLLGLGNQLSESQRVFRRTGGLHAAALFDAHGSPICVREDIGRHNAVDKIAGLMARTGIDGSRTSLMVSGRASFEIVQKAAVMRIPIVAAVSAPSSLAIDLALEMNQTLIGFLRDGRFNVYSGGGGVSGGIGSPGSVAVE
jgi:FdhD protein